MKDKYSILVLSYDDNKDLWKNFFKQLKKHAGHLEAKTYLTTNVIDYSDFDVISVVTDEGTTPNERLLSGIEKIEEEYILLFNDDYYVVSDIDYEEFKECIDFVVKEKCDYYNIGSAKVEKKSIKYKNENYRYLVGEEMYYAINFGITIWKKSFLEKLLNFCDGNIWKIEEYFKYIDTAKLQELEYPLLIHDSRKIIYYIPVVEKGKYIRDAYKACLKQNIELDLSQRELQSRRVFLGRKIKGYGSKYLPKIFHIQVKKNLTKMGMKFATNN